MVKMKKEKIKEKRKISWQQKLKDNNLELKERVDYLETELKNVKLNTGLECPLCEKFAQEVFLNERTINGMIRLEGKSVRYFYQCKHCKKTWE